MLDAGEQLIQGWQHYDCRVVRIFKNLRKAEGTERNGRGLEDVDALRSSVRGAAARHRKAQHARECFPWEDVRSHFKEQGKKIMSFN